MGCICWLEIDKKVVPHFLKQKKNVTIIFHLQVQKASDIIYNEGLNMYNLYDNCPHTTAGRFSRHEADLSNILRKHSFHSTMMLRAKNK